MAQVHSVTKGCAQDSIVIVIKILRRIKSPQVTNFPWLRVNLCRCLPIILNNDQEALIV